MMNVPTVIDMYLRAYQPQLCLSVRHKFQVGLLISRQVFVFRYTDPVMYEYEYVHVVWWNMTFCSFFSSDNECVHACKKTKGLWIKVETKFMQRFGQVSKWARERASRYYYYTYISSFVCGWLVSTTAAAAAAAAAVATTTTATSQYLLGKELMQYA